MTVDPSSIKVGDEYDHSTVTRVVIQSQEFAIFTLEGGGIRYAARDDELKVLIPAAISEYQLLCSEFETGRDKNDHVYLEVLQLAVSRNRQMLDTYITRVRQRWLREDSIKVKLRYLIVWFSGVILVGLVAASIATLASSLAIDTLQSVSENALFIFSGVTGGFISVCLNLKKLDTQALENQTNTTMNALVRILMAGLLGLVMSLVAKSNLFVPGLSGIGTGGIMLFSTMAGLSETLIPNLLNKVEKTSSE